MTVVPIPTIRNDRAWLDREALRIAAGVGGASRKRVAEQVYIGHVNKGVDPKAAADDAALALEWIEARLDQIAALRAAPALPEVFRWKA
ncbi:MAG: hypothetical protein O9256_01935 [Rhizobiaceae bacterium]|nr:hypothetical protein [Rhizobiaceae bacterium]MCZ8349842.1 hypothetical protein [Rhizobium sp.]